MLVRVKNTREKVYVLFLRGTKEVNEAVQLEENLPGDSAFGLGDFDAEGVEKFVNKDWFLRFEGFAVFLKDT
jgi:hypothetical protein